MVLRKQRTAQSREYIAAAGGGQCCIARGVDSQSTIRCSDDAARAFEDDAGVKARGQFCGDAQTICLHLLIVRTHHPRRLSRMWREQGGRTATCQALL